MSFIKIKGLTFLQTLKEDFSKKNFEGGPHGGMT